MSTQLAEKQQEDRVEIFPVVFQGSGNLRLIRVPIRKTLVHLAENFTEGLDYVFEPAGPGGKSGRLVVDEKLIQRDHEFFKRNDPDYDAEKGPLTLEWLRNRPTFGERFWELPPTPPPAGPLLSQITKASAGGDVETLVRLYEQEKRTFARADILGPVEAGLQAIEDAQAAREQPPGGADADGGVAPASSDAPQGPAIRVEPEG